MSYSEFSASRVALEGKLQQARQVVATCAASDMDASRRQAYLAYWQDVEANALASLNKMCQEYYGRAYAACFFN
jgi:hypothetical protein